MRPRWIALAAFLAVVALVGGASGMGSRVSGQPAAPSDTSAAAAAAASPVASIDESASPSPTASPTASVPPSIADVAMAIASRGSWLSYKSMTYGFTVKHPVDWPPAESTSGGWAVAFSDRDGSKFQISWRALAKGTKLSTITDEVWKTMHDSGYTVVDSKPGWISRQPAQILTVDGPQRHGVVGLVVSATVRYRVELWTRPGADDMDAELFSNFIATFTF